MKDRICIWCRQKQPIVTFLKVAHTIPQSLGGKEICFNVCDDCNHYFGSLHDDLPGIETVFKEVFYISRTILLSSVGQIGKNKTQTHFKSIYFDGDLRKKTLKLKYTFRLNPTFQNKLCHQFKRGILKVFLEETERQNQDGFDSKYDFIRDFARYNIGDYPVFYFPRKIGILPYSIEDTKHPVLYFYNNMKYLIKDYNFFEFELLGHVFAIPTSREYMMNIDTYLKESMELKNTFFHPPIELIYLNQIDLALNVMKD